MLTILLVIILLIFFIITIILILFLKSQLKLSVYNIKNTNYVKVNFLVFTIDLDYSKFITTIKRLSIESDITLKEQIQLVKTINPIFKDMAKHTVIEKAKFYKFFDEYSETYKVITFYLLSSYLNGFLEFNFKELKEYSYEVLYSKKRTDMDFRFNCYITVYSVFYVLIKNLKMLFKYFKRRIIHGS